MYLHVASHLLFAWLGFFSPSVPLHVLLSTSAKVNTAWKWIMLPTLKPVTIYDCAEGHLFIFSFQIPLSCGNFCLVSFPIFIHFQERHIRRLVCRKLNPLSGKVRLDASNMTLLEVNFSLTVMLQLKCYWAVYVHQVKIRYRFGYEHSQRSEASLEWLTGRTGRIPGGPAAWRASGLPYSVSVWQCIWAAALLTCRFDSRYWT